MRKSKKWIIGWLEGNVQGPNNSKALSSRSCRCYFLTFRDRKESTSYFRITLKGNYIRGYQTQHVDSTGRGINTFTELFIPALCGGKEAIKEMPITVKKLLVKKKLQEYKEFADEFRQLTPSLEWFDR